MRHDASVSAPVLVTFRSFTKSLFTLISRSQKYRTMANSFVELTSVDLSIIIENRVSLNVCRSTVRNWSAMMCLTVQWVLVCLL